MKLELPDNNASVLFHMGNALQSIARDIDTSLPVNGHKTTHTETVGDVSNSVTVEPLMVMATGDKNPINTDESERRYLDESELSESIDNMTNTIAADGLPWDQRIHSRGKTRLADNTWRMARKPSDKSDEEWAEYVEGVKTELKALMAIPVTVTYDPNEADPFSAEPPVHEVVENVNLADAFDDFLDETPTVVTPPVVDAVVTPPVVDAVVTQPVVDAVVTTGPTTFPEMMKFITVNNKKLTKESVDEALKAQGLASIALLAARTDLIPQVHAALVKLL